MSISSVFHTLRHWPAILIAKRIESTAKEKIRANARLWQLLEPYIERSPSTGVSFSDYLVLYNWVKKHKPREVLECGTGMSTVVIAHALRENEESHGIKGRVTSMEEYETYFESAKGLFPSELLPYAEILHSPAIEDYYQIFRGVRYEMIPERKYDFVFVDGPELHSDPKSVHAAINMDLIRLMQTARHPISAVIDTRTTTCFVYSLLFPKTFRYDYLRKLGIVHPSTRNDLSTSRDVVIAAMKRHAFQRPSLRSTISGTY